MDIFQLKHPKTVDIKQKCHCYSAEIITKRAKLNINTYFIETLSIIYFPFKNEGVFHTL